MGYGLGWAVGIVLDGGPEVLRDVAMATNFWLSMGYYFGCMIASDTLFDSRSGFSPNVNSRSRPLYAVDRPSVCLSSVMFVRCTQTVQIFGNISAALGALTIH